MARGADGIADVVQAIKETDQVKTFCAVTRSIGHFELQAIFDLAVLRAAAGAVD